MDRRGRLSQTLSVRIQFLTPMALTDAKALILENYRKAVEAEQQGRLDEAVQLYKAAFRLDSHVDQAYHRTLKLSAASLNSAPAISGPSHRVVTAISLPGRSEHTTIHLPDTLQSVLLGFQPAEVSFQPEDAKRDVLLDRLPDELVVAILRSLATDKDVRSIERFALICRKARILSLDDAIWRSAKLHSHWPSTEQALCRHLVRLTYVKPQILDHGPEELKVRYGDDYRAMFISHPRVRMDGVYISVCHCQCCSRFASIAED